MRMPRRLHGARGANKLAVLPMSRLSLPPALSAHVLPPHPQGGVVNPHGLKEHRGRVILVDAGCVAIA
jgi:hypothetical protein